MLIHDGDVEIGDPEDVARGYFRLNFEAATPTPSAARCRRTR